MSRARRSAGSVAALAAWLCSWWPVSAIRRSPVMGWARPLSGGRVIRQASAVSSSSRPAHSSGTGCWGRGSGHAGPVAWTAGSGWWRGIAAAAAATCWAAWSSRGSGSGPVSGSARVARSAIWAQTPCRAVRAVRWSGRGSAHSSARWRAVSWSGVGPWEAIRSAATRTAMVASARSRAGPRGSVLVVPGGVEVDSGQGPQGGVQVPGGAAGVADGGPEVGQGTGEVGEVGRRDRGGVGAGGGVPGADRGGVQVVVGGLDEVGVVGHHGRANVSV